MAARDFVTLCISTYPRELNALDAKVAEAKAAADAVVNPPAAQ